MPRDSYTDRQIEVANLLRSISTEGSEAEIEEILQMVAEGEEKGDVSEKKEKEIDTIQIKLKLLDEPDWRKRATLAALLISRSYD